MTPRKICLNCDGSGQAIIDFDELLYENIEGDCPVCKGVGYRDDMMLVYKVNTPDGSFFTDTLDGIATTLEYTYYPDDVAVDYVGEEPLKFSIEVEWVKKEFYENLEPFEL